MQFILCFCPFLYLLFIFFKLLHILFTWHQVNHTRNILSAGVIIIRRSINYPHGRIWPRIFEILFEKISVPKIVAQYRKLSHSAETTLIQIFKHWAQLYPIFIHWTELYPIFIHWADLYPILIHCWSIPYLNTLSRTIPYLSTLTRTIPYLNTLQSAANQIRVLRNPSRQPIRIECYVTRVVSQSESSITSPERSRLVWRSLLGSRLESARYSLS